MTKGVDAGAATEANRPPAPTRNADPATTRRLLLETGRQIIESRGVRENLDVKIAEVVRAAGRSTGSAYQIWGTQDEFQSDLAIYIAETFDWEEPRRVVESLAAMMATTETLEEMVGELAQFYFNEQIGPERFYVSLRFWAVPEPSPALTAAIQRGYSIVHEGMRTVFTLLLDRFEHQMRDPFTIDDLTVAITSMSEGMALRKKFDRAAIREVPDNTHLFAANLLALTGYYCEPISNT